MTDERSPITDSPWFWVYLFATAALIALLLTERKYDHRQAEIEREFSARQSHGHTVSGSDGPVSPPTAGNQRIRLRPLYYFMAFVLVVAWIAFYIQRLQHSFGNRRSKGD